MATGPNLRRSFNGQDTAPTSAETAVRSRPRRSIVRSLIVKEVAPSAIAPLIVDYHYLHSMPPAAVACFGVFGLDDELIGGVVITAGSFNSHRLLVGSDRNTVATLARLWLADSVPKNAESRVLAIIVRLLRRSRGLRAVVSYADPTAGHIGTIYQAAGWRYLGQSESGRYLDFGDGTLRHPRSVYSTHGTNSPSRLRERGINARSVSVAGKHRYCLVLDPTWAWRLNTAGLPYPRAGPQEENHPGGSSSGVVKLCGPAKDFERERSTGQPISPSDGSGHQ